MKINKYYGEIHLELPPLNNLIHKILIRKSIDFYYWTLLEVHIIL